METRLMRTRSTKENRKEHHETTYRGQFREIRGEPVTQRCPDSIWADVSTVWELSHITIDDTPVQCVCDLLHLFFSLFRTGNRLHCCRLASATPPLRLQPPTVSFYGRFPM